MADFVRIKYENPKPKQSDIADRLGYSVITLQRYKNDINMPLAYRIHPNNTNKRTRNTSNTIFDNISHREPDVKTPHLTLKQLQKNLLLKLYLLKVKKN